MTYESVFRTSDPGFFGNVDWRFLQPPPPSINGIRQPQQGFSSTHAHSLENLVNDAINSVGGTLGTILKPVLNFVSGALHPLFAAADFALDLAYRLIDQAWGWVVTLGVDVGHAVGNVALNAYNTAVALAGSVRNDLTGALDFVAGILRALIDQARADAAAAVGFTAGILNAAITDVRNVATQGFADVRTWASDGFNAARSFAAAAAADVKNVAAQGLADVQGWASTAIHDAVTFAEQAASDVRQWAGIALRDGLGALEASWDTVYRDVIHPSISAFEAFLDGAWRDAQGLLGVLEDAAGWLIWVTTHIIPEVEGLLHAVAGLAGKDIGELVGIGATIGAGRAA